ncbi:MAG: 3-dehydroquinate synthase II [Deltaproteobacteria bacterium]|jgi:3-dehydroquinate synthase II|nr:3-dehydroquinate synthase II [Desulfobacterales bacterium]MDL1975614.1 3-dehydroquinate synthase II [Deltaproteobacteria bacterium]MDL1976861.1 3-dehydroquinate synthase II [Deltaproteobacteria bacterium]
MKQVWVKAVPWNKKLVTTALESGADAVMVPENYTAKVKELGIIQTIAEDGDLKPGQDIVEYEIRSGEDEKEIVKLTKTKKVIVKTTDWTIIPLENLIAQTGNLYAEAATLSEAKDLLTILEKGVDGILVTTNDMNELKKIVLEVKSSVERVPLVAAKILSARSLDMGDRVCVDTCTSMHMGEGMLIGNSSAAMFLVHSESIENPYVAPRPFRVNAGPVHAYIRVSDGRTKYLSDLSAGDDVMIVDFEGRASRAVVGRLKIEKRPLMLVEAEVDGDVISTILQNAETIRLTKPDGSPISIVSLKKGDEVLVAVEKAGRHFGMKIDETIVEK